MHATLTVIRKLARASHITTKRDWATFVKDRISVSFTEPTLLDAVNKLAHMLDADLGYLGETRIKDFFVEAQKDGPRILRWVREHPELVGMLCQIYRQEEFDAAVRTIELPEYEDVQAGGTIIERGKFDIPITVRVLTGLAHGGDTKAGNTQPFRRRLFQLENGATVELPVYGGNAIRGQLRDLLADHFLSTLGLIPRRDAPPVSRDFFYMLYCGGALDGSKGGAGVKTDEIRWLRDNFPALSLLGTSYGNRVLPGRTYVGDLWPQCREFGTGPAPASELLEYVFLTRRDDLEDRDEDEKHRGMIAQTEILKAGTILDGGIDIDTHASELEKSALGLALRLLERRGRLGAQNRMGIGYVELSMENVPSPELYEEWLRERQRELLEIMEDAGFLLTEEEKKERGAKAASRKRAKVGKGDAAASDKQEKLDDEIGF